MFSSSSSSSSFFFFLHFKATAFVFFMQPTGRAEIVPAQLEIIVVENRCSETSAVELRIHEQTKKNPL